MTYEINRELIYTPCSAYKYNKRNSYSFWTNANLEMKPIAIKSEIARAEWVHLYGRSLAPYEMIFYDYDGQRYPGMDGA